MSKEAFKQFSDNELQMELKRRELEKKGGPRPQPLPNPDTDSLRDMCIGYIVQLDEEGYMDEDMKHYIFEKAMTTFYGEDVFKWINKRHS